jgi:hypothetical protein
LEKLKLEYCKSFQDIGFGYDIGCLLKKHLQTNHPHLISKEIFVSKMHGKCYKLSCQIDYSPALNMNVEKPNT